MEHPMVHYIVAAVPGLPPRRGELTTLHSASSYRQPVVVIRGIAYGTAEVLWLDGAKETRDIASRVGYKTLSDEDSRWPSGYEAVEY